MRCVILCAGRGKRLGSDVPKPLQKVGHKTVLKHIMSEWERCVEGFIVVTNPDTRETFEESIDDATNLPTLVTCQNQPKGIADAVLAAERWLDGRFVVVLGDCLYRGVFDVDDLENPIELGIGVWRQGKSADIRAGYGVLALGSTVTRVEEKPRTTDGLLCGMGVYFFNTNVFEVIRSTPPSSLRGEIEITDVIQQCIPLKPHLQAIPFDGTYVNINTPEDLRRAKYLWATSTVL